MGPNSLSRVGSTSFDPNDSHANAQNATTSENIQQPLILRRPSACHWDVGSRPRLAANRWRWMAGTGPAIAPAVKVAQLTHEPDRASTGRSPHRSREQGEPA